MSQKLNVFKLLQNTSFVAWLNKGRPADDKEWQTWIDENSDHIELGQEAADIVHGIPFRKNQTADTESQLGWEKIKNRIDTEHTLPLPSRYRHTWRLVATLLFLVVAGLAANWYLQHPQWVEVQTAYGETKNILLPDGSEVTLGANSQLSYDERMLKRDLRQLILKGEAFFQVQQQANGMPFKVETKDIYVEVLGTSFNINGYDDTVVVSLVEGSLRLNKDIDQTRISKLLEPQQTAWFDEDQQQFLLHANEVEYWTSWIEKEWSFGTGRPLSDVLAKIEAVYGLECEVKNPEILNKKLAGKVSIESKEILFESLSVLLDLQITQQGRRLVIE